MAARGLLLLGGVAAPAFFVAAWVVAGASEPGYSPVEDHLSGLAAVGAANAGLMVTAFVCLGLGAVAFGAGLERSLPSARLSARIIVVAGFATVLVGLFRRDCPLISCGADPSWHNIAHDVVSAPAFAGLILAPWFMPVWRGASRAMSVLALAAVLLFAVDAEAWGGALQRGIATLPLLWMAALAVTLATARTRPATDPPVG